MTKIKKRKLEPLNTLIYISYYYNTLKLHNLFSSVCKFFFCFVNPLSNMNDTNPVPVVRLEVQGIQTKGYTKSVLIIINTIKDEILVNPTNGHRTLKSIPVSYSLPINFSLPSSTHHHIRSLLHDRLHKDDHWLCHYLVPKISKAAMDSRYGNNGVELTVFVKVTYTSVNVMPVPYPSNPETSLTVMRMVLLGRMKAEELKSLNMETESCPICLQNLVSSSKTLTRMRCSHVFHNDCLMEWLSSKNTCPLCRTVLYDR